MDCKTLKYIVILITTRLLLHLRWKIGDTWTCRENWSLSNLAKKKNHWYHYRSLRHSLHYNWQKLSPWHAIICLKPFKANFAFLLNMFSILLLHLFLPKVMTLSVSFATLSWDLLIAAKMRPLFTQDLLFAKHLTIILSSIILFKQKCKHEFSALPLPSIETFQSKLMIHRNMSFSYNRVGYCSYV